MTTTLAVLVKLPSVLIGLPMLYLGLTRHGPDLFRRRDAWILATVAVLVPLAWYGHAFRISVVHPPHHFFGSGGLGFGSLATYQRILHEAVTASLTPALSIAAVVGALLSLHDRAARLLHCWFLAILLFALVAAPGHRHQWYLLPLVPVASAFAGFAMDAIVRAFSRLVPHRVAVAALGIPYLIVLGYSAYLSVAPLYDPWNAAGRLAGLEIDRLAPPDALVVAVDSGDLTDALLQPAPGLEFSHELWQRPS